MATPLEYYNSIPPVTKTYAVACLFATGAYTLELYNIRNIALLYSDVFKRFQIWRLITPFFFIGPFSLNFAFRLLTILYYGTQLERGPFDKRTADLVWMYVFGAASLLVMAAIPYLWTPFLGPSMVFVIVYVWGREFPNARINIHGLFELKGFYIAYYMIVVELVLGNPLKQAMIGIAAGHLYYFLTVLYPLKTGNNILKTPRWIHKLVAFWGEGFQINSPFRNDPAEGVAFRGRGRRLNGSRSTSTRSEPRDSEPVDTATPAPSSSGSGVSFRGRSHRLGSG
ncbi:derlin-1.2-like isoform X2 [Olea europaea var. sylvestris]|uniref:derlin-1.2-like isoform X2 n=1 Tax=Olea europaea var. sylvestris TaxID=158386 RepID=UPI000C1D194B|nr:derlin-1.2-like isoform X2 [Olea europaea var. sylvestris]